MVFEYMKKVSWLSMFNFLLVVLKEKCSAAVTLSRRKFVKVSASDRVLNYLKVHANTCRLHSISVTEYLIWLYLGAFWGS